MAKNHSLIIRVLLERQEEEINISKIAKYSEIDYKNTYFIIKDLEKQGLITLKSFGRNIKVILNKKIHPIIFETEFERRKTFFKNKDFLIIAKRLSELNFPIIALLFGSYAKGKTQKGSDIDLLIICEEKRENKIQEIIDLFSLKIHPTFISFEDFIKMLKTKEFNVVSEAVKNNIILVGIEDYYRLLENATEFIEDYKKQKLTKIGILPKDLESPMAIDIYGDKTAIMLWGNYPIIVLIEIKKITDGFKGYFKFLWKKSKKVS